MDGIYILGNDVVFDQVIALINSIQAHNGDRYPICVLPYNEQVERLKKAVANYATNFGIKGEVTKVFIVRAITGDLSPLT